jgi:hypothetical protein
MSVAGGHRRVIELPKRSRDRDCSIPESHHDRVLAEFQKKRNVLTIPGIFRTLSLDIQIDFVLLNCTIRTSQNTCSCTSDGIKYILIVIAVSVVSLQVPAYLWVIEQTK